MLGKFELWDLRKIAKKLILTKERVSLGDDFGLQRILWLQPMFCSLWDPKQRAQLTYDQASEL